MAIFCVHRRTDKLIALPLLRMRARGVPQLVKIDHAVYWIILDNRLIPLIQLVCGWPITKGIMTRISSEQGE